MRPSGPRLPYLARFAACDLFERTSLRITVAVITTIAAVVAFSVLARGLALGAHRVNVQRLQDDPLNRSLWYGVRSSRLMTGGRIAEIDEALRAALPAGAIEGLYPYSKTPDDWEWLTADGTSIERPVGRTIRPEDRLLESFPLREGRPPILRLDDDEGIVASPKMLELLGYDPESPPPESLSLRRGRRDTVPVPLLGVTEKPLPDYADFVVGERYEAKLRQIDPDPVLGQLRSGPVPPDWAAAAREGSLPPNVSETLDKARLFLEVEDLSSGSHWNLTFIGDVSEAPGLRAWRDLLVALAGEMLRAGMPPAPRLTEIPEGQYASEEAVPWEDHQFVAVVAADIEYLPEIERIVNETLARSIRPELAVPLNQGVSDEVIKFSRQTREALNILTYLSLGIALVAMLNLMVVEWLRAERKIPEWGLLKAVGMTEAELAALSVLEGVVLGTLGVAAGAAFGIGVGRWASASYYRDRPLDSEMGFIWSPLLLLAMSGLVVCLCGFGTWLANRTSRRSPPCESLKMR
ncbi:ABC transporter permease [Tautonia plasticadhaerens]|uniref:FtsX-like permease family protein n=1 Tax=Tautonia plasticadhaerens TaxID=2527974 RepID=A0A518H636_9BACT|nr:ABC transporter permease [Tautonia plasticadhaerens]QDV36305.1 FtsX-like permease family protein [Tautonia plasticadhaerens]